MSRSHIQESCLGTVFRDHVWGSHLGTVVGGYVQKPRAGTSHQAPVTRHQVQALSPGIMWASKHGSWTWFLNLVLKLSGDILIATVDA